MELIQPWKNKIVSYKRFSKKYDYTYDYTKEPITDEKTIWKRGDIIKFGSGFYEHDFDDWKDWFFRTKKEKEKYWQRIDSVPKYARYQYAILMCRCKITKYKRQATMRDYTSHLMFLTGSGIGKIRVYINSHILKYVQSFPYNKRSKKINDIFHKLGVENRSQEIYNKYGNTCKARTMFIEEVQQNIFNIKNKRKDI